MPTVFSINGFRFFFYSSDRNEPAHVHVKKGGGDAKIWLEPEIERAYMFDFKEQEESQILKIVKQNHELLLDKWHEYFNK